MAHEEGNLNSFGAVLGNDVAIKAYREESFPSRRHNHRRFALQSHPVGGEQQSLWPRTIFRSRPPYEHSVHGQGLKKVRRDRRMGVRSFQPGWQTGRRGADEKLLPLPQEVKLATLSSLVTHNENHRSLRRK